MGMVLDGRPLAAEIEAALSLRVGKLGRRVCLATILVGDDPSSATYVRMKGGGLSESWS
jgi:methylenetetrahydrofolate dehydrogenase (NADP+) / methenyltetrahydrofolate cyclohydrolase